MFRNHLSKVQNKQLLRGFRLLKWVWIVFLGWIVIGGILSEILQLTGFVGSHCDMNGISDVYPPCTPCQMHHTTFGVFITNDCPNVLTKNMLEYGIAFPRLFVASLSLLIYVLADFLYQIAHFLPVVILIPAAMMVLLRTLFVNFVQRKNIERGLHRGLLAGWLLLATLLAV